MLGAVPPDNARLVADLVRLYSDPDTAELYTTAQHLSHLSFMAAHFPPASAREVMADMPRMYLMSASVVTAGDSGGGFKRVQAGELYLQLAPELRDLQPEVELGGMTFVSDEVRADYWLVWAKECGAGALAALHTAALSLLVATVCVGPP